MSRLEAWLPAGGALRALDVAVGTWAVAWVVVAIFVAVELSALGDLSDTVGAVGRAAESSGAALGLLGNLPLAGGFVDAAAEQIQEAGRRAQASAESSRRSTDALTVLLAAAIALIPSVPTVTLYLPARIGRRREVKAVEEALRRAGDDPRLSEFLARRAVGSLSYRRLSEVAPEPWREFGQGRYDRLARAELERLGLRR